MTSPTLFTPVQLGALQLPNRIIMAPLTRCRAGPQRIPNALMAEYYRQRATAGLIISEATSVDRMGVGYPDTPGIWSDEQVTGWKLTTDAVHAAGGRIILQLWHVGRVSDPVYLKGERPISASALRPSGHVSQIRPRKEFVVPRAIKSDEIPGIVAAYRRGAENAQRAGFDGVEIHGANGYLLEQFLHLSSNKRTDQYGDSIPNRARLMMEVADACIGVWGAERVGMHLSLRGDKYDCNSSDAGPLYRYVAAELGRRNLAFIFAREHHDSPPFGPTVKEIFGGPLIANQGFTRESTGPIIAAGLADAVSFGQLFIANPDLVRRFREHAELNEPDTETFYQGGARGYTDYPVLTGHP